MADSKLPPVAAAEVAGACSDEIISGTNSSGFQAVNGAAWGRIFGKQDCNSTAFTQDSADSH
jgi:hypothetical protein